MQFTKRSLQTFKRLYLNEFGEELSDEVAEKKAQYLLEIYRVVYGLPMVGEQLFDKRISDEK